MVTIDHFLSGQKIEANNYTLIRYSQKSVTSKFLPVYFTTRNQTMQTSIQLFSNTKPTDDAGDAVSQFNRGIFQIVIPPIEGGVTTPRQKMRFIMYVSIDASGSMAETATKRGQTPQSKMQFVHMTMTNMIEYIASQEDENPHAEFYLAVVSFQSSASCVLLPCRVTKENKEELIQKVTSIMPGGGTNFQKCFQEIARIMSSESQYIPNDPSTTEEFITRMHVFLTDGANNEGERNIQRLVSFLTPTFPETSCSDTTLPMPKKAATQIMVGYGPDHDSTMLQTLCTQFPNSKQWFIDDVEKTGCIFGEILWSAMNTAFSDVKLISNVEIFDFATMSWKNELNLDDIIYETTRTVYIRVPWNVETVTCQLTYFSTNCPSNTSRATQQLITYEQEDHRENDASAVSVNANVERELWRLDTIATIDEALKFLQNIRRMPYNTTIAEKDRLIGVVTAYQDRFLTYVAEKNLNEDPFMIQLADDLFVCINGLMAASIGERYVAARQASQIQQRAVTVNDITPLQTEIISSMPSVTCATNYGYNEYIDDTYPCFPPPAPRRANSGGGCVADDTYYGDAQLSSPKTPTPAAPHQPSETTVEAAATEEETKENEKIIATFTPTSRGVGSKLRHLSRDAIIGLYRPGGARRGNGDSYDSGDEDYYGSCGGAGDDTFSSHASPGCARIGRILSSQTPRDTALDRTSTCPF